MTRTATMTLIGGPTLLIEFGGRRLLTDPTFDLPGDYRSGAVTLRKTSAPALAPVDLLPIDAVLLSHDQHFDNLDRTGRAFLPSAALTLTTPAGAARLAGNARGLAPWQQPRDARPELPMWGWRTLGCAGDDRTEWCWYTTQAW